MIRGSNVHQPEARENQGAEGYDFFWPFRSEVNGSTTLAMKSMRASRAASAADMVDGSVSRLFGRLSAARSRLGDRLRLLEESL